MVVLAVDPGREKCGVAVVKRAGVESAPETLHQAVVDAAAIGETVSDLAGRYSPDATIIGDGTGSQAVIETVWALKIGPVELIDETNTTLAARQLYFKHNPPRGLRRLVPLSLQIPPRPYDDYVAVILAKRRLEA